MWEEIECLGTNKFALKFDKNKVSLCIEEGDGTGQTSKMFYSFDELSKDTAVKMAFSILEFYTNLKTD